MDEWEACSAWSRAWAEMLAAEEASRVEGDASARRRLLDRGRMAAARLTEIEQEWGPIAPVELSPARPRPLREGADAARSVAEGVIGEEDRARA